MDYLRVSQREVQSGFARFGLLDDSVHFHKASQAARQWLPGCLVYWASLCGMLHMPCLLQAAVLAAH